MVSVLDALADGRALPVGTLAAECGRSPAAVRAELSGLVAHGSVEVVGSGRYRYFRLAGGAAPRVPPVRSLRGGTAVYELRLARRCYGHLAGRLGVAVTDVLRSGGLIKGPDGDVDLATVRVAGQRLAGGVLDEAPYRLTAPGRARLEALGVRVPAALGEVRCCVDWTEQRHHLAGPLGAALLDAFAEAGWVTPAQTARALEVTPAGVAGFTGLGVPWPPPPRGAARTRTSRASCPPRSVQDAPFRAR